MLAQQPKCAERDPILAIGKRSHQACLLPWGGLVACTLFAALYGQVSGDTFRVQTTVYDGKNVVDRRTTLFRDQLVIDFSDTDSQVTTQIDMTANELVLVDHENQIVARISASQMGQILAEQQKRIRCMPPKLRQVLVPELSRAWDAQQRILSLGSPVLDYTATLVEPNSPDISVAYRTFADWMARFNAIRPGGNPPAPRLKLNQEICNLELVPSEVRKTVNPDASWMLRTRHQYHWGWRPQDHSQVRQILHSQRQYHEIEIFEFIRRLETDASGR